MHLPDFLIDRYNDWKKNIFPYKKHIYQKLEDEGQKPNIMIISCCDSRVNASTIFQSNDGDFFVHRNIANIIPPFNSATENQSTLASIEYAIKNLKISDIVILGHSSCGGINHAYQLFTGEINSQNSPVDNWVKNIEPSFNKLNKNIDKERSIKSLEKLNIINSISNLIENPEYKKLISNNKLRVHGLYFEIASGNLMAFNNKTKKFEDIN
jgi:carbonic anhydrase